MIIKCRLLNFDQDQTLVNVRQERPNGAKSNDQKHKAQDQIFNTNQLSYT